MKQPRESQLDKQARHLMRYFKQRAHHGGGDARRDWLYAPAYIAPGSWDMEGQLNTVIRRAKDLGADEGFELVYVYGRPPVWTCEPTEWVRDVAVAMEAMRDRSAWERIAAASPDALHIGLATSQAATLDALWQTLRARNQLENEPAGDPCLARIDKIPGMAN